MFSKTPPACPSLALARTFLFAAQQSCCCISRVLPLSNIFLFFTHHGQSCYWLPTSGRTCLHGQLLRMAFKCSNQQPRTCTTACAANAFRTSGFLPPHISSNHALPRLEGCERLRTIGNVYSLFYPFYLFTSDHLVLARNTRAQYTCDYGTLLVPTF